MMAKPTQAEITAALRKSGNPDCVAIAKRIETRSAHRPVLWVTPYNRMALLDMVFGFMRNYEDIQMLRAGRMPQGRHAVQLRRAQLERWIAGDFVFDADQRAYEAELVDLMDMTAAGEKLYPFDPEYAAEMIVALKPQSAKFRSGAAKKVVEWFKTRHGVTVDPAYIKNFFTKSYTGFGVIKTPDQWDAFKLKNKITF